MAVVEELVAPGWVVAGVLDAECFDAFLGSVCGEVLLRGDVLVDGGMVSVGLAAAVWTPRLFRRRRLRWLAGLFRRVYEVRVLR